MPTIGNEVTQTLKRALDIAHFPLSYSSEDQLDAIQTLQYYEQNARSEALRRDCKWGSQRIRCIRLYDDIK